MECTGCKKLVNNLTVYCDQCGTQLQEDRSVSVTEIDEWIDVPIMEQRLPERFEELLKEAYFLSISIQGLTGESYKNAFLYFDYVYLRMLYDEDKELLIEDQYSKKDAKAIVMALKKQTITKEVKDVLERRYKEEYPYKTIPERYMKRVPQLYLIKERKQNKIAMGRHWSQILLSTILSFLISYILLNIVLGIYLAFSINSISYSNLAGTQETIQTMLLSNPIYMYGPFVAAVAWALFKGPLDKKVNVIQYLYKHDKAFRKQLKKELRPLWRKVKRKKQ